MFTRSVGRIALLICVCLLASVNIESRASVSEPLVFTVNSTLDQRDLATNGVCSIGTPVGGACTLRAAVSEAIGNLPYQDVIINIPAGNYLLTIPPDAENNIHTGDLDLPATESTFLISIIGIDEQPAVIDANQLDRVFRIGAGVQINMSNLVIRGGIIQPTDTNLYGAGIANHGDLLLDTVTIESNRGLCDPITCTILYAGAGIAHLGLGDLTIIDSTIRNNTSYNGSAIYNDSAKISIRNSTIAQNYAVNSACILNHGSIDILNSTISGNSHSQGANMTIYNNGTLNISSSTLSNPGPYAGITNTSSGTVTIKDSIIAAYPEDFNTNCSNSGAWTSYGYNIYSDNTCPANLLGGDLINTDAQLGPLGNWGGPTMTMPLNSKSPALNHRPTTCMLALGPLRNDQRYYPRNDTLCDTGAFEGFINLYQAFLPLIKR